MVLGVDVEEFQRSTWVVRPFHGKTRPNDTEAMAASTRAFLDASLVAFLRLSAAFGGPKLETTQEKLIHVDPKVR